MPIERSFSFEECRIAAEGLSAIAISSFETEPDYGRARESVLLIWEQLGKPEGLFKAASETVSTSPQPAFETVGQKKRTRWIREKLGVPSVEKDLVAMLSARELSECTSDGIRRLSSDPIRAGNAFAAIFDAWCRIVRATEQDPLRVALVTRPQRAQPLSRTDAS